MSQIQKLSFITIIFLGLLFRLTFLDRIPTGINDDELNFVINSKAISYGLNNFYGTSVNKIEEYSSWLFSPIIGHLPLNLFNARLPYIAFGVITIVLIFAIIRNITKNVNLGLYCAFFVAINPWSIYVSRTSFDGPIAITLFLTSVWLLTHKNRISILASIVFGYLGFNSYIGTKTIYLPMYLILSYYSWKYLNQQRFTKIYLLSATIPIAITGIFFLNLNTSNVGNRTKELISLNSDKTIFTTNTEKNQSLQSPFKPIFSSKVSTLARTFINKYLESYSSAILFTSGDHTFTGSLWKMGYFYYLDSILIIIGGFYLLQKHKSFLTMLLALLIIAPIPEAIRSDELPAFVFHSALQFPILCVIIGAGAYHLYHLVSKHKLILYGLVSIYVIMVINFIDIYFFKYPVYQPEGFAFSRRIVSNYLIRENHNNPIYVLTNEPNTQFRTYLFYSNSYNKENSREIVRKLKDSNDHIKFDHIVFLKDSKKLPEKQDYVLITSPELDTGNQSGSKLSLNKLSDNSEVYRIYRSNLCAGQIKDYFSHNLSMADMSVETLSSELFCQKYLSLSF